MRGIEQAGITGPGNGAELHGLSIDAPEVQIALALSAYRAKHDRQDINPADFEQNDEVIQTAAMREWIGDMNGKNSLAMAYRTYAEEHPHKRVDTGDDEMLEDILATLTSLIRANGRIDGRV